MTAYHLLGVIGLFAGGEVLSALGPFHLTSHLGAGDGFVFGCGCWFLLLVGWCFLALVFLVLLFLFSRLCTIRSVIHKL